MRVGTSVTSVHRHHEMVRTPMNDYLAEGGVRINPDLRDFDTKGRTTLHIALERSLLRLP
jgi:hypothetical protein